MVYSSQNGKGGLAQPRVQFAVAQSFLKGEVGARCYHNFICGYDGVPAATEGKIAHSCLLGLQIGNHENTPKQQYNMTQRSF